MDGFLPWSFFQESLHAKNCISMAVKHCTCCLQTCLVLRISYVGFSSISCMGLHQICNFNHFTQGMLPVPGFVHLLTQSFRGLDQSRVQWNSLYSLTSRLASSAHQIKHNFSILPCSSHPHVFPSLCHVKVYPPIIKHKRQWLFIFPKRTSSFLKPYINCLLK